MLIRGRPTQRGVSLIEVLIAMIILSFGILTAVGLQLVSKRNNVDSAQHTIASYLAYDLIERMRLNAYIEGLLVYTATDELDGETMDEPDPDCTAANCSSAQLAAYDLWDWEQALIGAAEQVDGNSVGGLAQPMVCLAGPDDGTSGVYSVVIAWRAAAALPADETVACGLDSGRYGDDNEYRRTLTVRAFILTRGAET